MAEEQVDLVTKAARIALAHLDPQPMEPLAVLAVLMCAVNLRELESVEQAKKLFDDGIDLRTREGRVAYKALCALEAVATTHLVVIPADVVAYVRHRLAQVRAHHETLIQSERKQ